MRWGCGDVCLSRLAYVAVGVATFVATYLFLENGQAIPNVPSNQLENAQAPARDGKSDRLQIINDTFIPKVVRLQKFLLSDYNHFSGRDGLSHGRLSYFAYYQYSEVPPDEKPAQMALDALKDVPVGTAVEEIRRASDAFGLDFNFMKAVAKIESDFNPDERTGSYAGLFQLSSEEFHRYGYGDILSPRDNAIAAAAKFSTAAALFELRTHTRATLSDLYLIHQQGPDGAEQHISHPDRLAWQSMCATDEGKQKGEQWCKRAIWDNTTPEVKQTWKSVDRLTSGVFVKMLQDQVDHFYERYSEAAVN
jgi:Transglycosylase SLT domain